MRGVRSINTSVSCDPFTISVESLEVLKIHENIKNRQIIATAKTERGNNLTISTYTAAAGSTNYIPFCRDCGPGPPIGCD